MKKKLFLLRMNWKPLFLLLSTSLVIVPFGLHRKVHADAIIKDMTINNPTIDYGYFSYTEPSVSIASYARSKKSKTLFAVAVTTDNQVVDKNGLVVPTALFLDCKEGRAQVNFMEKLPVKSIQEYTVSAVRMEMTKFCQLHKEMWKHSDW